MADAAVFTVEKAQQLMTLLEEWQRSKSVRGEDLEQPQETGIHFRNDSGVSIPAYAVVQVRNTVEDGINYLTAKRAFDFDATQTKILFNGPVEVDDGKFGTAQNGPVFRVITDGAISYAPGDRLGWKSSAFTVQLGASLVCLGADAIATNCVRVMIDDASMNVEIVADIAANSSGTAYRREATVSGWSTDNTKQYTIYNQSGYAIIAGSRMVASSVEGRWVIDPVPPSASDTLETFQMTSNWLGGIATATFTNLSEPAFGNTTGILEDPEGIFVDVLGAGGRGLSIRTRYGRHYVIQAKCKQTLTPPANTGACEVYIEGEGTACVITTEAACDAVGGDFAGAGTTACP